MSRRNALDEIHRVGSATQDSGYGRVAGLGLQFAASVGLLAWLGWWADARWGTSPLFVLLGVALGFTGGFVSLVRGLPSGSSPDRTKDDDRPDPRT